MAHALDLDKHVLDLLPEGLTTGIFLISRPNSRANTPMTTVFSNYNRIQAELKRVILRC